MAAHGVGLSRLLQVCSDIIFICKSIENIVNVYPWKERFAEYFIFCGKESLMLKIYFFVFLIQVKGSYFYFIDLFVFPYQVPEIKLLISLVAAVVQPSQSQPLYHIV